MDPKQMPLCPTGVSGDATNSSKNGCSGLRSTDECDKIAERWSLLNQSRNINDEELMSLFDISEKNQ